MGMRRSPIDAQVIIIFYKNRPRLFNSETPYIYISRMNDPVDINFNCLM